MTNDLLYHTCHLKEGSHLHTWPYMTLSTGICLQIKLFGSFLRFGCWFQSGMTLILIWTLDLWSVQLICKHCMQKPHPSQHPKSDHSNSLLNILLFNYWFHLLYMGNNCIKGWQHNYFWGCQMGKVLDLCPNDEGTLTKLSWSWKLFTLILIIDEKGLSMVGSSCQIWMSFSWFVYRHQFIYVLKAWDAKKC